jgi:predicted outer membrane repeat protein
VGLSNLGTLEVVGGQFSGNVAWAGGLTQPNRNAGGGLAVRGTSTTAIRGVTLADDVVDGAGDGGGLDLTGFGTVAITDCTLARDKAGDTGAQGLGGGIHASSTAVGSSIRIVDTVVEDNDAGGGGGASLSAPVVEVVRGRIAGNTARDRGYAAWGAAGLGLSSPAATVEDVTIEDNVAAEDGGGVSVSGTATLSGVILRANQAGGDGGGVHASNGSVVHLQDGTSVSGNLGRGAGVALGSSARVDCTGSAAVRTEIVGNAGSAVYLHGRDLSFTATSCDLGEPGTARDNGDPRSTEIATPVWVGAGPVGFYRYGDGASFTCDVAGCR